ncbi:transitional endoplasmic reticulum ATPase [Actinomycetospora succinea]|uniref:Transitional endoplasmic reticulum ATPase n=2 Tax=Actinomycetospora succinea TaxID=663603 RepID=A0A4R6V6J7_9PSEU|nr:transitional endoplasmic reticulum ATPase [Actinomycetospora succinea]
MSGLSGIPARIRALSDDERYIYAELITGKIVIIESDADEDESPYTVGELLLLSDALEIVDRLAPRTLWPTSDSVGVVKKINHDKTLVEFGSAIRAVPTLQDVKYEVGNTVEADEVWGVSTVLSELPISVFDRGDEADDIEQYIVEPDTYTDSLDSFGGSEAIKNRAQKLVEAPMLHAERLEKIGAKSVKGVLFTGRPGTGKTKLAKILAHRTGATLYAVNGPQVFNKWYGSSEKLVKKLFEHAAGQEKSLVFFDEIDSVAGQRNDSSHEASKRVVAALLTAMDGLGGGSNVVVVATTNRPQDIDEALRRPGRFDSEIEFTYPNEPDRLLVLQAAGRGIAVTGAMPFAEIARGTSGWSQADLASIWTEAALFAAIDGRESIRAEDFRRGLLQAAETRKTRKRRKVD